MRTTRPKAERHTARYRHPEGREEVNMQKFGDDTLLYALRRLGIGDVVRLDFLLGLIGGGFGIYFGIEHPERLFNALPVAASLVGVIIGVVLAAATLIAAFFNPQFLRKMRAIEEDPVVYLAPVLLSGALASVAALGTLALACSTKGDGAPWLASVGGLTGFAAAWAIASTLPNLTSVIRFIRLQQTAAEVPDDLAEVRPLKKQTP